MDHSEDEDIQASPSGSEAPSLSMHDILEQFRASISIKDRRYRARIYRKAFVGSDAVGVLQRILQGHYDENITREQATALGNYWMQQYNLFEHVAKNDHHPLYDDYYFYRFVQFDETTEDNEDQDGMDATNHDDSVSTFSESASKLFSQFSPSSLRMMRSNTNPTNLPTRQGRNGLEDC